MEFQQGFSRLFDVNIIAANTGARLLHLYCCSSLFIGVVQARRRGRLVAEYSHAANRSQLCLILGEVLVFVFGLCLGMLPIVLLASAFNVRKLVVGSVPVWQPTAAASPIDFALSNSEQFEIQKQSFTLSTAVASAPSFVECSLSGFSGLLANCSRFQPVASGQRTNLAVRGTTRLSGDLFIEKVFNVRSRTARCNAMLNIRCHLARRPMKHLLPLHTRSALILSHASLVFCVTSLLVAGHHQIFAYSGSGLL